MLQILLAAVMLVAFALLGVDMRAAVLDVAAVCILAANTLEG
jgi:hypothetical protein